MIGKKIQTLRMKKGISLTRLADRAGIAKSYLSMIERDLQSNPSIQFLQKISVVLEVPIETLILSDKKTPYVFDEEWAQLIHDAIEVGISRKQFREWLEFQKWRQREQK